MIIIDNNSSDGTRPYLKKLSKQYSNLKAVFNRSNLGCAKAWNISIKMARTEYIALLNNDIIVTPSWLEKLLEFSIEKKYLFSGPAYKEGDLNYDINKMYKTFTEKNKNKERKNTYTGFAMCFHKSLFEKVGLFSEKYSKGTYEDFDLIMRLKKNNIGFSTTGSAFIHHFKSKTQDLIRRTEGNDYEIKNRETFFKKWGRISGKGIIRPRNKVHREYIKLKNRMNIWS